MNMGEKIHELRVQKGLTLEQLGDLVGVGKSTVRKWENGMIANMKRDKILKVSEALGVSPAYLMGWTDAEKKESGVKALPASAGRVKQEKEFFEVTPKERSIIERYRRLDAPGQDAVDWMLIHETARTEELRTFSRDIDAEVEDFRRELEMEKRTARSQAFGDGNAEMA